MARLCFVAGLLWPAAVGAEPESLGARLECQRRAEPGRVLCEAELEVEAGAISWADVMVVDAPEFAPPLRARVGPDGVVMKTERRQRLQLALAATGEGVGELSLRARVVVCPDDPARHCAPLSRRLTTLVEIGPILR